MAEDASETFVSKAKKRILAGVLAIIPIAITYFVLRFLLQALAQVGAPVVASLSDLVRPSAPGLAGFLQHPWFKGIVAVLLVVVALYLIGWLGRMLVGRQLLRLLDAVLKRIPLVETIYGSVKTLIATFQEKPDKVQRVVLIDFPSEEMKAVGFVTRTLTDADTGRELAAVYVPTTPNPTSGYLEIVPLAKVTSTTWTVDEAMKFIVSGGAVSPPRMNYDRSAGSLEAPPLDSGPAAEAEEGPAEQP